MLLVYTVRNLLARRGNVIPTALTIAATTAAITLMLGMVEGLLKAINDSGSARTVIIKSRNSPEETASTLPVSLLNAVRVAPGVAQAAGAPLVSPELVIFHLARTAQGFESVTLRGVEPEALALHRVTIRGRFPGRGEAGLVVGARRAGTLEGAELGGKMKLGKEHWPVVGILEAPGTVFESELWADRAAAAAAVRHEGLSVIYAALEDPAALSALASAVARDDAAQAHAISERDFYRALYADAGLFTRAIAVIAAALALGAIIAAINAMYTAFLSRLSELATLRAIGFTRARIGFILAQEALVLAVASGAVGIALALAFHGRDFSFGNGARADLIYSPELTARVLLAGATTAAAIGLVSGLVATIHAYRMRILAGLRSL